jgi:hypothetical protein
MADKLISVAQDVTGQVVTAVAEQASDFVKEASDKAASDKAQTLGDMITNHTCSELTKGTSRIIDSVIETTEDELRTKINSKEFTTDFINVLQTKLLDGGEYEDQFLKKFDILFDTIMKKAYDRYELRAAAEADAKQQSVEDAAATHVAAGTGITGSGKRTKRYRKSGGKKTKRVRFSTKN